ncbi:prepilin peptidase [Jannaschia rubra]|uniref:prepilin peptidase n=1 Tax=Jannaschia rubra TaxID=282197 RepID=UPI0024901A8D|nr:prepilin peptidase [Jannaschia rubra]
MFTDLAITQTQAIVFGLLTLPICLWVVYTDVARMKIRNEAVLTLLAVFVVAGALVMPLGEYAWRYVHFVVALTVCFGLTMTIGMGAGDSKFIAAVAPLVALGDLRAIAVIYAFWSIVLLVGMMTARRSSALRTAAPGWIWFEDDRKGYVPFGLALAPTVSTYFYLGAMAG